jgi:hypothetical protein
VQVQVIIWVVRKRQGMRARCSFSARFRYDSFKLPTLKSINNYTNKNEIIMHPKRK